MNKTHQEYQSHRERVHQGQEVKWYLSRREVLNRFGIGNTTLYRWMESKEVNFPRPVYLSPKSPRWSQSSLETWEQERQEASL